MGSSPAYESARFLGSGAYNKSGFSSCMLRRRTLLSRTAFEVISPRSAAPNSLLLFEALIDPEEPWLLVRLRDFSTIRFTKQGQYRLKSFARLLAVWRNCSRTLI